MKYDTSISDYEVNGTHLQGHINCRYDDLVRSFGKPRPGDEYKVDAEWVIKFEDGTVATVYNWKNGIAYCGRDGLDVEEITEWNIGGHNKKASDLVRFVILGE